MASQPERGKKLSKLPRGVYEKVPGSKDYWIRFTDDKGKLRRQHIGRSLSAARDIAEQRRTEVRQGKFNPDSVGRAKRAKWTVAQMFKHYLPLRTDIRNKVEDKRYAVYWSGLFGDLELDELVPADLDEWRAERIEDVAPATVNRALTYLKAYYNLARRDRHCGTNPAEQLKPLRENNARTRFLSSEEETKLAGCMEPEDFRLVVFAIHSGLRRAEQFSLRWEHVNTKDRVIKIAETKSGKHRFVPLNRTLVDALEQLANPSPWVFPTKRQSATHLDARNFVARTFRPALTAAGIEDFTWHDLRHTFGSRLAMKGESLHTIGQLMGHSNPRMTARYAHLSPSHLREAVSRLDET